MKTPIVRAALTTAVITLALVAMPSQAIAPLIALLGKVGGLDAGQLAELAELQRAMGAPLSPPEAYATIDEMSELGCCQRQ